jgi:hypothetical protein
VNALLRPSFNAAAPLVAQVSICNNQHDYRSNTFVNCSGGNGNTFASKVLPAPVPTTTQRMLAPLANDVTEGERRKAVATGGGGGAGAIAIIYAPAAMSQSEEGSAVAVAVVSNNSHEFHDTTVERCTGGSNHRFEAEAGSAPDQATAIGGGGGAAGICVIVAPAAAAATTPVKVSTTAHTIVEQNQVNVHTSSFNGCNGGGNISFISNKASVSGCSSGYARSSSALGGGGGAGALAVIHGPAASTRRSETTWARQTALATNSGDSSTLSSSNNNSQTIATSNFSGCTGGKNIGFDSSGSNQSISAVGGGGGAGALAVIHGPAASSNQPYVDHDDTKPRDGGSATIITTCSSDGNLHSIASSSFNQCMGGESISFGSSGYHTGRYGGDDDISAVGGGGGAGAVAVIHGPAVSSNKHSMYASITSSSNSNSQIITTSNFSQCTGGKNISFDGSNGYGTIAIGGGGGQGRWWRSMGLPNHQTFMCQPSILQRAAATATRRPSQQVTLVSAQGGRTSAFTAASAFVRWEVEEVQEHWL